ncbi:MAG: hypothetical protein VX768_08930 [Planctomycetota bacterium]|nr:hypothetical protein [Planctomycetota bacterium]
MIEQGGKLLQQLDENSLKNANDFLRKQNRETLQSMLMEARMDLDRPGVTARIPAPTNKEAIYLALEIRDRVDEIEKEYQAHPVASGEVSAPEKYTDYEKKFWDLHVFRNQLTNALRWIRETETLLSARARRLASLEIGPDKSEILGYNFGQRATELQSLLTDLEEREAFLRIFRIHDTIGLDLPGAAEKDKFTFAYFLETDILFLKSFFKRFEGVEFQREDLNDQSILSEVSSDALAIREKYSDKIEKGQLLFLGMHWWFRGRYGSGPIARGLLKAPGAHLDEKALFPLAMPRVPPRPLDPYKGDYRIPHYERRHHYTWQVQQEQVYDYQKAPLTRLKQEEVATPREKQYKRFY